MGGTKTSAIKAILRPQDKIKVVPSQIKCKAKRIEVVNRLKLLKKKARRQRRSENQAEVISKFMSGGADGEKKVEKKIPNTVERMREEDETIVQLDDEEVMKDEEMDEFSKYFTGEVSPKICITTCKRPSIRMLDFIRELLMVFPNSIYFERRNFEIKAIVEEAKGEQYTDILVLNEDKVEIHSLMIIHLPFGPTALFRLSSLKLNKEIPDHGAMTPHNPEVILNNFNTRLGHRIGRMMACLFDPKPDFEGRRVATFHNQRDYVFFRQHRYIFEEGEIMEKTSDAEIAAKKALLLAEGNKKKAKAVPKLKRVKKTIARLQELGPQFTLKLRTLQHGTFDSMHGEYEFKLDANMQVSRKKFFL